ncbi:MAG: hypothetical protein IJ168_00105 [Eubacterium sp.]|nr:hypothetical protein [Eubacterium sp.]
MKHLQYTEPELTVIKINAQDVITASGEGTLTPTVLSGAWETGIQGFDWSM